MSLTNPATAQPIISPDGNRREYVVNTGDLVQGGAFTTVDIILDTFPAGNVLDLSRLAVKTSIAGTSFSAATARLYYGPAGSLTALGSGAADAFAAVGTVEGTSIITSTTRVAGDSANPNQLVMRVTSTGGNLAAATAGKVVAVASVVDLSL